MGLRGPAPRATHLKLLDNVRADRVNANEPVPAQRNVVPPEWLVGEAREIWDRLAPDMHDRGLLTDWDCDTFGNLCDAIARRNRAVRLIAKSGEIVKAPVYDRNGKPTGHRLVRNPALLTLDAADAQVLRYSARFGLTPADRANVHVEPDVDTSNPFAGGAV